MKDDRRSAAGAPPQDNLELTDEAWLAGERPSAVGEFFLGNFRHDLIYPFPLQPEEDRRIGDEYAARLTEILRKTIDPDEVDRSGEVPAAALEALAAMGAFGMKIPQEYGGLGLSQINYNRAIELVSSYCGSTAVCLSAHQSIGAPQPLKVFGTAAQKEKFLPRLARGEISAFALTEPGAGSDPANMRTRAEPDASGTHYLLNGEKLWITNGPVAQIMIVMACTPSVRRPDGREKKQITAFIVERSMPGVEVAHRCTFMGLKGIQNGVLRFRDVRVPRENILGEPGQGLKIALTTLNTGRMTVPAACLGLCKLALQVTRGWIKERIQWGRPIGLHEAVASRVAYIAGAVYAMEALTYLVSALIDRGQKDVRLEAALAKLFCSGLGWRVIDQTMQVRGGRGYEEVASLKARGEAPLPIERMLRDFRINTIIEGTSDILRLFLAREALESHARRMGAILGRSLSPGARLAGLGSALAHYAVWYPKMWLRRLDPRAPSLPGGTAGREYAYLRRASARLALKMFHAVLRHGPRLPDRQLLLRRFVDIGACIYVSSCTQSYFETRRRRGLTQQGEEQLARLASRILRGEIRFGFLGLAGAGRSPVLSISRAVMDGEFTWLERGILPPTAPSTGSDTGVGSA